MDGIERVTIEFDDSDEPVVARITVKENGIMAVHTDESDTGFYEFWGPHLSKIIVKLQDDIVSGAATGGIKDSQGE